MDRNENTLVSGVALPLLQAVVSAFLLAVAAYAVAGWLEVGKPFSAALVAFGVVSLLSWFFYRSEWRARLEALAGIGETVAIAPPVQPVLNELVVHVVSDRGREGDYLSLPGVDREQLVALARGIVAGRGLSIHSWTGNGRPFSRSQFEELRNQLVERGFVKWVSDNSRAPGCQPTKKGMALMRALASDNPSPLVRERGAFGRF